MAQVGITDQRLMIWNLDTAERRSLGINGSSPHFASSGHLLFWRLGALFAAPFDLKALTVTAPPVPVVEGVATNGSGGAAVITVASNGTMAYVKGGNIIRARTLVWVDRRGNAQPLLDTPRDYRQARLSPDGQRIAIGIEGSPRDLWIYEIKRGTLSRFTLEPTESEFAAWTPDGRQIAFGALRPGRGRLLLWKLTDGSGSEEMLLAGGPQDHFHPAAWSSDGSLLALTNASLTETGSDIWVLPRGKAAPVRPMNRAAMRSMFNLNFDVTADGQRFLMFKATQAAPPDQITVVLDWATELTRRVPIPR